MHPPKIVIETQNSGINEIETVRKKTKNKDQQIYITNKKASKQAIKETNKGVKKTNKCI